MKSFFFSLFLLSLFASPPPIVFIHLGDAPPNCLLTTLEQARFMNHESACYLLLDKAAQKALETKKPFFDSQRIEVIDIEELPQSAFHADFMHLNKIDKSIMNGFWNHALERFFYLFDFIAAHDLENVFHFESDCMLYVDLTELLPFFEKIDSNVAAPFQSKVGCIPCLVFIKDEVALAHFLGHVLIEMEYYKGNCAHIDLGDMQSLARFYQRFGSKGMTPLPILMEDFSSFYSKRTSNFAKDNETPLEFLSLNSQAFKGFIFDAATLGVFANGNDRRYFTSGPGAIHYRSLFDPTPFDFFWGKDLQKRRVPYIFFRGQIYRIANLHFHSKLPEDYTSFKANYSSFPKGCCTS